MLTMHIIAAAIITICIRRLRREIRKASGYAKLWLERCISLEAENAHLRLLICRFERGEPVPEGEIDAIMAQLRRIGLIRPPTTTEKGHDSTTTGTDRVPAADSHLG